MVVFRPFASEVILAKVKSSDEDGVRRTSLCLSQPQGHLTQLQPAVTVGFFDDIYVPLVYLPEPTAL